MCEERGDGYGGDEWRDGWEVGNGMGEDVDDRMVEVVGEEDGLG